MPHRLLAILKGFKVESNDIFLFLAVTIGYGVFNVVNHWVTQSLYFETGAHIIHLPSGVRMVIVLVAGLIGALAILVATLPYTYFVLFTGNLPLSVIISLTTPLIPLTTLLITRRFIRWQSDFSDLTLRKLSFISMAYAVTNATVQQFIYYTLDLAARPINAWLVMFTGDILGIVIVLYLLRLGTRVVKNRHLN